MIDGISALRSITPTGSSLAVSGATTGGLMTQATSDFSQVLGQIATDAVGTLRQGESAAIQGIQGKASLQSVVQSVMAAEQTLQTSIAVRDKAVAAYQEISRMAI